MTNPEESAAILEHLSRMGVLVSVDDFGTGYSSMSYLRRFPIDKLKIDRGFVSDLMTRADDASIVQAIISLAHSLRLKVVAEGVETPEQLALSEIHGLRSVPGIPFQPAVAGARIRRSDAPRSTMTMGRSRRRRRPHTQQACGPARRLTAKASADHSALTIASIGMSCGCG